MPKGRTHIRRFYRTSRYHCASTHSENAAFTSSFSFLSSSSSSSRDSCASHCRMPYWRSASDLPLRPTSYILLPHLQGLHLSASNVGICSRCASCVSFQISSLPVPSAMALTRSVSALSSRSFARLDLYLASLYARTLSTLFLQFVVKMMLRFLLSFLWFDERI